MNNSELINKAITAMEQAYSPYSKFCVGAALLSNSGKVYLGANIENASFSATVCAERTAFFEAVKNGDKNFCSIAVVGGEFGKIKDFCYPCGVCRQVMQEFCDADFEIVLFNGEDIKTITLGELLPFGFGRENLC